MRKKLGGDIPPTDRDVNFTAPKGAETTNADFKEEPAMQESGTQIIETITAVQATERLRALGMKISPDMVRRGIQQKIFPFGDCIMHDDSPRCFIYTKLFEKWIAERAETISQKGE